MQAVHDDILRGAGPIAAFVFGDPQERRKVYHLADRKQLPVVRLGAILCARKSTLLEWISQQERQALQGAPVDA
jgi:hypothetical protein